MLLETTSKSLVEWTHPRGRFRTGTCGFVTVLLSRRCPHGPAHTSLDYPRSLAPTPTPPGRHLSRKCPRPLPPPTTPSGGVSALCCVTCVIRFRDPLADRRDASLVNETSSDKEQAQVISSTPGWCRASRSIITPCCTPSTEKSFAQVDTV